MRLFSKYKKAILVTVFALAIFMQGFSGVFLAPQARAQTEALDAAAAAGAAAQAAGIPFGSGGKATMDVAEITKEKFVDKPLHIALLTILMNLLSFVANRLAYDLAVEIASGGKGETPLFQDKPADQYFKELGVDLAGQTFAVLSDTLENADIKLNLCTPSNPFVKASLQLGIKSQFQRPKPRCEIRAVLQNWQGFVASFGDFSDPSAFFLSEAQKMFRPGENELSASIQLNSEMQDNVLEKRAALFDESLSSEGFKAVTDVITGKVETPSALIKRKSEAVLIEEGKRTEQQQLDAALSDKDAFGALGLSVMSVFLNTLLSQLTNNLFNGLFKTELVEVNPFSSQSAAVGGREAAKQQFKSLQTASAIPLDSFSPISSLVTCAGENARNVFSCAMDSSFASAVSRSEAGAPITVREALDEGLLRGNLPLIHPQNKARNQDPFCYLNGYCYGNLVKLRKFRIIPVGWELAASSVANENSAATLEEVVDSFNDCNSDGQVDVNHPWCHLIDPNWVLKAPEFQCRASAIGELLANPLSDTRLSSCIDSPSCIGEDDKGQCTGGFGYCTREKNIWRFGGDSCPAQYATCLDFTSTTSGKNGGWLLNTVDFDSCNADNAGCLAYRSEKSFDNKGTADPSDDGFEFATVGGGEDMYFNRRINSCQSNDAGCTELIRSEATNFNIIANPSFEDDTDADNAPDYWQGVAEGDYRISDGTSARGADSIQSSATSRTIVQEGITLSENRFYTLSFFAWPGSASTNVKAKIALSDAESNRAVNLNNTTILPSNCTLNGDDTIERALLTISSAPQRFSCTFTSPNFPTNAKISFENPTGSTSAKIDAVQLEEGSLVTDFRIGYGNDAINKTYLKLPPKYLGCDGRSDDPKECDDYARVCGAQDASCELYTPEDGDPPVPAVVGATDICPAECVGYDTFKQAATLYESEKPLNHFIANTAAICSEQAVGCDEFTNMDTVAQGGEGLEYYSRLRSCVKPDNTANEADYLTWEGTDNRGYQLVSWKLLKSDKSAAPCTKSGLNTVTSVSCNDDTAAIVADTLCNAHEDIFINPDCREFYDSVGVVHYRRFSQTTTVTNDCHPYRKSVPVADDCVNSGGLLTAQGECRYLGYPAESVSCSSSEAGCRKYTGGAGRNTSSIFIEDVESGTLGNWSGINSQVSISSESIATGGHSIHVTGGNLDTLRLVESSPLCADGAQCVLSGAGGSSCIVSGTGASGDDCGALVDKLVRGKIYTLSFWAKGVGAVKAEFVDNGEPGDAHLFDSNGVSLSGGWVPYSLGTIDTSAFANFNDKAILRIFGTGEFYIDNIILKEAEENITLIKNSWITPSTCDATPAGVASPQFFLGCEAYKDRAGNTVNTHRFTRLCSEDVIGCKSFFNTQNSSSPYAQTFNATCELPNSVSLPTECKSNTGATLCTIKTGKKLCEFNGNGALPEPAAGGTDININEDTVVVPNDTDVFVVDDDRASCSAPAAGCMELGLPKYNQDRTTITGFESRYLLNQPDRYVETLCRSEELFCEEWKTSKDGNYYFKDPVDKQCEWKEKVMIGSSEYFGWFKKGTSTACYSDNLIEGSQYGVWRNGDSGFAGWAASCPSQFNRCTQYIDPVDTSEGKYPDGKPYNIIKNEKINEENQPQARRCNGQVSQKEGCALFDDVSVPEKKWNASASYIASRHADVLFGVEPESMQSPVSCENPDDAIITLPAGGSINLCWSRCSYSAYQGYGRPITGPGARYFGNSCVADSDCPSFQDSFGNNVTGFCSVQSGQSTSAGAPTESLTNDVNAITKVNRDRSCAQWLACSSSVTTWDERTQKYRTSCSQLNLCDEYSAVGDTNFCTNYVESDPVVLTSKVYSSRDVSWNGSEYSGDAIPYNLPTETLDQINVRPMKWCVDATDEPIYANNGFGYACSDNSDCTQIDSSYKCDEETAPDYRLGYIAGPCDGANGSSCSIGFCEDSGSACSDDGDCASGDECVVGFCEAAKSSATCFSDTDCADDGVYNICKNGICTDATPVTSATLLGDASVSCVADIDCGADAGGIDRACVPDSSKSKSGVCVNNSCLQNIKGEPLNISATATNVAEPQSCRAYPEPNSPFATDLVDEWIDQGDADSQTPEPSTDDSVPYNKRFGYQSVQTCAPNEVCSCTYNKSTYGQGGVYRYYSQDTDSNASNVLDGICMGGKLNGKLCNLDADCQDSQNPGFSTGVGSCMPRTAYDTYIGLNGFCLERDTQINLFGDSIGVGPCVSWLPIDNLTGSTDLNGKFIDAGFQLSDAYYCAEVGFYRDYFVTGAVFDNNGNIDGVKPACAESLRDDGVQNDLWEIEDTTEYPDTTDDEGEDKCDYGEYDSCWWNAACPVGYIAMVGYCGSDTESPSLEGNVCKQNGSYSLDAINSTDDDCPYFCLPMNSYKYDTGESCEPATNITSPQIYVGEVGYTGSDSSNHKDEDTVPTVTIEHYWDNLNAKEMNVSRFGTPVLLVGDILEEYDSEGIARGEDIEKYKKCVRRGVPYSEVVRWKYPGDLETRTTTSSTPDDFEFYNFSGNKYAYPNIMDSFTYDSYEGYANLLYSLVDLNAGGLNTGAYAGYLGCYVLAQTATADKTDSNKAWTDRTWAKPGYELRPGGAYEPLAYAASDEPVIAGRAKLNEYYSKDGNDFVTNALKGDTAPVTPRTCATSGNASEGKAGLEVTDDDLSCAQGVNIYPTEAIHGFPNNDNIWALSYEKIVSGDEDTALLDGSVAADGYTQFGSSNTDAGLSTSTLNDFLGQFFGKTFNLFKFDWNDDGGEGDKGAYKPLSSNEERNYDLTESAIGATAPKVISLGACFGNECKEGADGKFTVNDSDSGDIIAGGGTEHINVKFFATANNNQFPIKNVIVDWGNGRRESTSTATNAWASNTVGSIADDNFYRAHRGLRPDGERWCGSEDEWGLQATACESNFFNFSNDYLCAETMIDATDGLPVCEYVIGGDLKNSPCQENGACVFQPRVYIKDNWGYCAGSCPGGPAGSLCYDGESNASLAGTGKGKNECDIFNCPGVVCTNSNANPWIYYDGVIRVEP